MTLQLHKSMQLDGKSLTGGVSVATQACFLRAKSTNKTEILYSRWRRKYYEAVWISLTYLFVKICSKIFAFNTYEIVSESSEFTFLQLKIINMIIENIHNLHLDI